MYAYIAPQLWGTGHIDFNCQLSCSFTLHVLCLISQPVNLIYASNAHIHDLKEGEDMLDILLF